MCLAEYLGRYVHQTAIANSRLESFEDRTVSFWYYDNQDKDEKGRGTRKLMALDAVEFIRRCLRHVLPHRYMRIRHFGLHASGARRKLWGARFLLGLPLELPPKPQLDLNEWRQALPGADVSKCSVCQHGTWRKWRKFGQLDRWRIVFLTFLGLAIHGYGDEVEVNEAESAITAQKVFA